MNRFKMLTRTIVRRLGWDVVRRDTCNLIQKPIDQKYVEILEDASFRNSVEEVSPLTLLDTPRLANLWNLSRMTDPKGALMEIGTFRGGGALHLSNANPLRNIYVCDSFTSFKILKPGLDDIFNKQQFIDTTSEAVSELFASRNRKFTILEGFFPDSTYNKTLLPISFVHLDVDVYEATRATLKYLVSSNLLMPKSVIVLDDYQRRAKGVDIALSEFLEENPNWLLLPMFPSQALLLPQSWFSAVKD